VAGAELRLLAHEGEPVGAHRLLHGVGAVAGDDDRPCHPQLGGGIDDVLQ
jgi:hypothetical protein